MESKNRNTLVTHRYQHKSRVFLESFAKASVAAGLAFVIGLHLYAAVVLYLNELLPETTYPTLVFDGLVAGGCFGLLAACGRGKRGPLVEWLSWLVVAVVTIYAWIWFVEYLGPPDLAILFFPGLTVIFVAWCGALLASFGYIVGAGIGAIVSFFQHGATLRRARPSSRVKSGLTFQFLFALVLLAPLASRVAILEGTVKRTVSIVDANDDCNLCVWDLPDFLGSAQIPGTPNINLSALTLDQNRTLAAFGAMNTTFYAQLDISVSQTNITNMSIAKMKVLGAFNLTMVATIWDDTDDFPGPGYPKQWIQNARATLEFVIDNNLTQVIGICADSEAGIDATPEDYWEKISMYDAFLKEVQTNGSLVHPDPARGTFETVLCYAPQALQDFVDGDQDVVVWDRELGLPPNSWTDHHFMLYRLSPADNPSYLHNYLVLAKRYLGTDAAVPIVGLTGVDWFAEGYTDGLNSLDRKPQLFHYDGVDGWEAMKREILYPKAMGFHSVSVFHLNSYGNPLVIEGFGLLDYYGIDAIEDLAAAWHAGLTIEYPISSMDLKIGRQGFFNPNAAVIYDLFTNPESMAVLVILLALAAGYSALKACARWLFPGSYRVIERGTAGASEGR